MGHRPNVHEAGTRQRECSLSPGWASRKDVIVDNEMALVATLAAARCPARVGPGTGGTA